jgi:hypothetical protein
MAKLGFTFRADKYNPGRLLSMYLVHSCLYYDHAEPLMSDREFDELAGALCKVWPTVRHVHKHLIDESMLFGGGSAYYLTGRFPAMVKGCARRLLAEANSKRTQHGKELIQ